MNAGGSPFSVEYLMEKGWYKAEAFNGLTLWNKNVTERGVAIVLRGSFTQACRIQKERDGEANNNQ